MAVKTTLRFAVALLAATCLASPGAAVAQGTGGAPGMPPDGRRPQPPPRMLAGGGPGGPGWQMLLTRLELTDQQKTDVKKLLDEAREADRPLMEQVRTLREQLASAILSGSDPGAAAGLVTQLAQAELPVLEAEVALQQKIAAVLTEAQRARLLVLITQPPPRGGPPPM